MELHFGRRQKISRLPEPAWGLSRYAFDELLLGHARAVGAQVMRGPMDEILVDQPLIVASGRQSARLPNYEDHGRRLFGFKAHFEGPAHDAVELYFFNRCYVGINPVEGGRTNVCGLGPEDFLRLHQFDYDRVMRQSAHWRTPRSAGTLHGMGFDRSFAIWPDFTRDDVYAAGDALSFVDPFTGLGLIAAVKTGALAEEQPPVMRLRPSISPSAARALRSRSKLRVFLEEWSRAAGRIGSRHYYQPDSCLLLRARIHEAGPIKKPVSTRRKILTGRLTTTARS